MGEFSARGGCLAKFVSSCASTAGVGTFCSLTAPAVFWVDFATTAGKVCVLAAASTASMILVFLDGLAEVASALGTALGAGVGAALGEALGIFGFEVATLITPHRTLTEFNSSMRRI